MSAHPLGFSLTRPCARVYRRWLGCALASLALAGSAATAAKTTDPELILAGKPLPFSELEPFVVKGEELSLTVYARSGSDRRYAQRFAQSVVELAYDTIGRSTGNGLVIVGDKGEPHPLFVLRQFQRLQEEGKIHESMTGPAAELGTLLADWEEKTNFQIDSSEEQLVDRDVLLAALPLPLSGVSAQLYLLAWSDAFDGERVGPKLTSLRAGDLDAEAFSKYDWVFYLPPRSAMRKVIKQVVPKAMKKAELGFAQRLAVRSALVAFRPIINDAVESLRKGMLYLTVLQARSGYSHDDVSALTEAYVKAIMPHGKILPGNKDERAREAIEAQKLANAEYAKNPFVAPTPLINPDLAAFESFTGPYGRGKNPTHHFSIKEGQCYWQYLERDPGMFHPAGERLLVSGDGTMIIEFMLGEDGAISGVEERWARRKNWVPARPTPP